MQIFGHIDLEKFGQLMNALLHKITDDTAAASTLTNEAQVGYHENENRILYYDGNTVRKVATLSDISANGSKTIVAELDPVPAVSVVEGDGWFKKSTNQLQIRTNTGWEPANSNSANIPMWAASTDFVTDSLVIFGNQLWLNTSGSTNNDAAWTPGNWTQIGGATLVKVTATITPAILDATTVGNITRTGTAYVINHALGSTTLMTRITESNKVVFTDEEIVDANNIELTFNTDAQTSGKTYVVTIASI